MFPEKVQNMKFILSMKCKIKEEMNFLQTLILYLKLQHNNEMLQHNNKVIKNY